MKVLRTRLRGRDPSSGRAGPCARKHTPSRATASSSGSTPFLRRNLLRATNRRGQNHTRGRNAGGRTVIASRGKPKAYFAASQAGARRPKGPLWTPRGEGARRRARGGRRSGQRRVTDLTSGCRASSWAAAPQRSTAPSQKERVLFPPRQSISSSIVGCRRSLCINHSSLNSDSTSILHIHSVT